MAAARFELSAERRTLARLMWSARVEGLLDGVDDCKGGLSQAMSVIGECLRSLHPRSVTVETLARFELEVKQSMHNEALALDWWAAVYEPAVRKRAALHDSLWSYLCSLPLACEQQQIESEVLASFDGHPTHPCAKTKLAVSPDAPQLTDEAIQRMSPEFGPRVHVLFGGLSSSAASEWLLPAAGADPSSASTAGAEYSSVSAYMAAHLPQEYDAWQAWLRGRGAEPHRFLPLPLHPANMAHVRSEFASLLEAGLLLLPSEREEQIARHVDVDSQGDGPSGEGGCVVLASSPLMSCRTVLPRAIPSQVQVEPCQVEPSPVESSPVTSSSTSTVPAAPRPYIKLPMPVQATSLVRSVV